MSGIADIGTLEVRVSKDGHKRDGARGHPSRRPRCARAPQDEVRGKVRPGALRCQDVGHGLSSVIAGLDPAIHLLCKTLLRSGWTRGSSPRVTSENG